MNETPNTPRAEDGLEQLVQAAMGPRALPMTAAQIAAVVQSARSKAQGFPAWALAVLAGCLIALAVIAVASSSPALPGARLLAALIPLANFVMAPFAALAIIRKKRSKKDHAR